MPKNELITDFILVVKGAGVHKIDQTLHMFFQGFYPAVRKLERQGIVEDVKVRMGRESHIFKDFYYTPFYEDQNQKIVEITLTEPKNGNTEGESEDKNTTRRIWIKEAYWEPHLDPPGSLKALFGEWNLTSFSLRKLFEDFFFPWHKGDGIYEDGEPRSKNKWKNSYFGYFLYYFLAYASVLGFIGMVGLWGASPLQPLFSITRKFLSSTPYQSNGIVILLGVALIMAFASAVRSKQVKSKPEGNRKKMPGLGSWLLWALVAAMIFQPLNYLALWLTYFLLVVLPVILARKFAWGVRPDWYSDTPVKYFVNEGEKYLDFRFSRLEKITQLLYRFFVVTGLPVALAVLLVSKLFLILNLFGDAGTKIETAINSAVNLILGDVTAYALDPAQAASVQNVIEEEIKTFADLSLKGDESSTVVDSIHVFAHSQGTPITYEVLYHLLEEEYRKRIRSYLTIGSVLNLHNQTNEVLDKIYWDRFPPVKEEYEKFTRGFKWFNFWNFTDPITQFTGLDAFRQAEIWIKNDGKINRYTNDNTPRKDFANGSPFSIKSKESISRNHSEYWTNVDEIQYPFVKHILRLNDQWLPDEWASPDILEKMKDSTGKKWNENLIDAKAYKRKYRNHRWLVFALWLGLTAVLLVAGTLIWPSFSGLINPFLEPLTGGSIALPADESIWNTIKEIYYDRRLTDFVGLVLLGWTILEFVSLMRREKEQA